MNLATARAPLFVPANRLDRIDRAISSGADGVILDLEDSVPLREKEIARQGLQSIHASLNASVRVSNVRSDEFQEDMRAVPHHCTMILLAKAESVVDVDATCSYLSDTQSIVPLIETVVGFSRIRELASHPRVSRLAFGSLDFKLDSGIGSDAALLPIRVGFVVESVLSGLPRPLDSVVTSVGSSSEIEAEAVYSRELGFGGRLCIHPNQIDPILRAFTPRDSEITWARRVIDGDEISGGRPFLLDGQMIDKPVVTGAKQLLAGKLGRGSGE